MFFLHKPSTTLYYHCAWTDGSFPFYFLSAQKDFKKIHLSTGISLIPFRCLCSERAKEMIVTWETSYSNLVSLISLNEITWFTLLFLILFSFALSYCWFVFAETKCTYGEKLFRPETVRNIEEEGILIREAYYGLEKETDLKQHRCAQMVF